MATVTKLTKRTSHQGIAASLYLADIVSEYTRSSITFSVDAQAAARRTDEAIAKALADKARGAAVALRSIRRALDGESAPAKATTKTPAKAKAEPPATGPRGELLDRKGVQLRGKLRGYSVTVGFREFEVIKHSTLGKAEGRWAVRCVAHGSTKVVLGEKASAAEAERQGARKARAAWCPECRAADLAKVPAKAPAKAAPAKKAPRRSPGVRVSK